MFHYSMGIPRAFVFATLFLSLSYAQDFFTPENLDRCERAVGSLNPSAQVNSTGQVAFTFDSLPDEKWYLSLTLNDTRSPTRNGQRHDQQSYLSFPNSITKARGAVWQFNGVNRSAVSTGWDGCEGLFSTDCYKKLIEISFGGGLWRTQGVDNLNSSCPWEMLQGGHMLGLSPYDFLNQTCNTTSPPGVDTPEGYITIAASGKEYMWFMHDQESDDFTWYDMHVRRPVPFIVAAELGSGNYETKVICVTPDTVLEGSRAPEDEEPWENAEENADESAADWLGVGKWARGVALAVAAMHLWFLW